MAIKGTMNNALKFLSNTLKVQSIIGPISIGEENETVEFNNTDFVIAASYRFSRTNIASALSVYLEEQYSRPYFAVIYFNPRKTPNKAVSEND